MDDQDTYPKIKKNFILNTESESDSYPETLNTEPCVNISKLKSFYCQNFTAILNNPEFSFIDEVVTKFQRIDTYAGNDIKRLYDSSSNSSPKKRERKNKKPTLKSMKDENFEEYIKKIEKFYIIYKKNHKNSGNDNIILLNHPIDDTIITNYYRVPISIDYEYLNANYKIKDTILNLKIKDLFLFSEELTEKCGELDFQMNKLLYHSNKLFNYINQNLELENKVEFFLQKIVKLRNFSKILKEKLLKNALNSIKRGIKKSNFYKVQILTSNLRLLKENLEKLKIIINDSSKIQDFFDIYNKSSYIIDFLKFNKSPLRIIYHIEEEYKAYFKKISDKLYKDFIQFSIDLLYKSVVYLDFTRNKETNNETDRLNLYSQKLEFDLSVFKQSTIFIEILCSIEYSEINQDFRCKLNEILSFAFKVDIDLGLKIRILLKKIFNDEIISNINNLSELFIDAYNINFKKNIEKDFFFNLESINQCLFIFLLSKVFKTLYESLNVILQSIQNESINYLKELNVENDQITEYELLYSEEINEIRKICSDDMTKFIEKYLTINFDTAAKSSLNNFLITYKISSDFLRINNILVKTNIENTLLQLQENFIFDYFTVKVNEINMAIENEEWKEVSFHINHQNIVSFIFNNNINDYKDKQSLLILNEIIKYDVTNEELSEQSMTTNKDKYKIICSILNITRLLFDTEKIIFFLNGSLSEIISQKIIKIIKDYSNKCSNMIIGGEAYKLKKISINQKNICVYISSLMFLNELTVSFSKSIKLLSDKNIIGIDSLLCDLDKYIMNGKQKILDLSLDIIVQSFTYVTFNWQSDSSTVLKEKIEKFFNKQKTILTIYSAMSNYLPQNLSIELSQTIIKNLIDNYKKSFADITKIENKNNAKQFRILMEKVKKLIEYFKITDSHSYCSIFDDFINNYAPKPLDKNIEKNDD